MTRIDDTFQLSAEDRKAFVAYMMGFDPDRDTSLEIMRGLPGAGVDIIELGMPFTDPMADGPTIQAAGQRALAAGGSVTRTLEILREFRKTDNSTPVVLMGYYNPIYARPGGVEAFLSEAKAAGVDGLIVVDLPPEEDAELCIPATRAGLNFIRLATPTTDDRRLVDHHRRRTARRSRNSARAADQHRGLRRARFPEGAVSIAPAAKACPWTAATVTSGSASTRASRCWTAAAPATRPAATRRTTVSGRA